VLGDAPAGFHSLGALLDREPTRSADELRAIQQQIDPTDPAVFQLSGGTTGIPKLIPRTHNDYVYNSKTATTGTGAGEAPVLRLLLPIAHNLPLACPGLQGFLLRGGKVVLSTSVRPPDVFALVQRHGITHIHVVPALLIRWINDPTIGNYDLSS